MKNYWITAALLSCALVVGCGDRGPESAPAPEAAPAAAPAAEAPPAEPAPAPEAPAAAPAPAPAPAPRATAGERPAAPRPAARPAPAPEAAPRAAAPAEPPRPTFREVSVPANTALSLELTTALSSETATVETPVTARLRQAVSIDGATVLPAGTVLRGNVTDVERPGRVKGRARLVFRFTEATVDGQRETIRTNPISFEGEATRGEDATKVGAGAGIGAVIGGIVGGGSGAAKGAAIGGAAGTGAVLATRGRDVELAPGTEISTTLAIPFQTQIPAR